MSGLLPRSRKSPDNLPALVSAFESETQAVIQKTAPYSDRAILHGLAILVVVAIVLMCVLKLDRIVVTTGKVVPTGGAIFVQPLDRGIVRSIAVKVGDVVRKGQVLAVLDPTFAGADAADFNAKQGSDSALVARLEAEQAGVAYAPKGKSPAEMLQLADWRQRRDNYRQSLVDFDARIASDQSIIARATEDARNYEQHFQIAADLEGRMKQLEDSGYGATIKTLSARDTRIDAARQLAEAKNQAEQASHDLASLRAQKEVFITKWRDDIATLLVTARNDLNTSTQSLVKANRIEQLGNLVSPADAVVLQIGAASTGSVVDTAPGDLETPLFTLTPLNGPVEADVRIESRDVAFIKPGDKVRVKFDAYRYLQHGTADGVIKTVSEGSFTKDDNGQPSSPYFKARVAFTKIALRNVPKDFRLVPGMTLSGDVLIGSRTIMSYIVEGAMRTGSEAMREPG